MRTQSLVACCLLMTLHAGPADARSHSFRDTVQVEGTDLVLQGRGILRYKRIFPVYDAALYLPPGTNPDEVLGSAARRLEVVHRTDTKAKRFADAGNAVLVRTLEPDALQAVQERLDRINALYPDPVPGDRCAITYIPSRGTELNFNGKSLGWIEGEDFATIYFSIWLGRDPASVSLRNDLLNLDTIP